MTADQLKELLEKYLSGELSETDFQQMWTALQQPEHKETLQEVMRTVWDHPAYHRLSDAAAKQRVWEQLNPAAITPGEIPAETPVETSAKMPGEAPVRIPVIPLRKNRWWAAAAAILLLGGAAWMRLHHPAPKALLAGKAVPVFKNDVPPGNNKAVLTLGDGSTVTLDSGANKVIGQGIQQHNGQLQYNTPGATTAVSYNTLTTPRGGQFQIVLPDGTKVWLNAASSIRYPTAFTGPERKVDVTGEAYFEVAANAGIPFRVGVNQRAEIEVLGTHFNINAYPEEANINTTLLEGKVKVMAGKQPGTLLLPGEQASLNAAGNMRILKDIDTDQIIAWKDGWFQFHLSTLPEVMRQVSRWYDVEVSYQGTISDKAFEGRIQRDLTLTQMLKILEKNQVRFQVNGKKIIVLE